MGRKRIGPAGRRGVTKSGESRGRRDSGRRQQIINSALALFSTRPYEEISVDEVCERAGVAHGLISYYFGGKRGLFAAAVQQAWRELIASEKPREDERTPAARVYGFVRRHFEYVRRHPERFATLLRTGHADPDVFEIVVSAREKALAELQISLGCPVHPPAPLRIALHGWMGHLDNMTLDWAAYDDLDIDYATELCVQALVSAVRTANGHRYDVDVELEVLGQVAATAGPSDCRGRPARRTNVRAVE
ncbi:MAG TPA: TetR/AcrR family transcriptional regulator [Amycolatopsis sp.]|uniref:TetR/AcrR family transcriptional regulator n=1 Tax=Amycolatopsis sp. TaxID=37632 RepID=UPI002B4A36D3|nr:TetR/AcrR family transcriptional regulator [Amycolatopsis sp.]HKS50205.1 TetR/AcrR family transcriptional regulator [Amycolatopsis sp.]